MKNKVMAILMATGVAMTMKSQVGINTNTPDADLEIISNSDFSKPTVIISKKEGKGNEETLPTDFGSPYLQIGKSDYISNTQEWTDNNYYTIGFGWIGSDATYFPPAEIGFIQVDSRHYSIGDLVFATRLSRNNERAVERMRIDNIGNVSIKKLSGTDNAYACLNPDGTLYRSNTACR